MAPLLPPSAAHLSTRDLCSIPVGLSAEDKALVSKSQQAVLDKGNKAKEDLECKTDDQRPLLRLLLLSITASIAV